MARSTFAVLANCQGWPLIRLLLATPAFAERFTWLELPPVFDIPALPAAARDTIRKTLRDADLLLYQRISSNFGDFSTAAILAERKPGSRSLGFPNCYFTGYHPEIAYFDVAGRRVIELPSEYNDINLLRHVLADDPVAKPVARMRDPETYAPHLIERNANDSLAELKRREQGLEITSVDYLTEHWRSTPLFNSFNHPTTELMAVVANRVLRALGLPGLVPTKAAGEALDRDVLPIYAAVAKTLGFAPRRISIAGTPLTAEDYVSQWFTAFRKHFPGDGQEVLAAFAGSANPAHRFCADPLAKTTTKAEDPRLRPEAANTWVPAPSSFAPSPSADESIMPKPANAAVSFNAQRKAFLAARGRDADFIVDKCDPQSMGFMSELVPVIGEIMSGVTKATCLDVGARTAAGSSLLATIFSPETYNLPKMQVSAMDLDGSMADYAHTFFPEVTYLTGDVFEHQLTYDLIVCSHTIEHIAEPKPFIARLQAMARGQVLIACPFDEPATALIPGHLHSIDMAFIQSLRPTRFTVFKSLAWHQSMACWFVLPGLAKK